MSEREKELERRLRQLLQHISKARKRCKENNLWLIAGFDALKDLTDEAQQGPLITRLFELVDDNKNFLKGIK